MADKVVLEAEIKSNIKAVTKETKELTDGFGAFGITVGGVKQKFKDVATIMRNGLKQIILQTKLAGVGFKKMFSGQIISGAKTLFTVIKTGIAATGVGLLVVAFASLVEYFRRGEEGANNFQKVVKGMGVVIGNISDILSNFGELLYAAVTFDVDEVKKQFAAVKEGIKNLVSETKRELEEQTQLQTELLALQRFEREAMVDKAKTEAEIMRLRLKARDEENFSVQQRLEAMKEANKLAAEQLEKDLHVAKEKHRIKQAENSLNQSSKEDLDEEARLKAAIFQIERSNYSERKRMKSEEQALVKQQAAQEKARLKEIEDAEKARLKEIADAEEKARKEKEAADKEAQKKSLELAKIEMDKKIAYAKLVEQEKNKTIAMGFDALGALTEKSDKAQKAVAVAKTIYNTQQAIMNAMANVPAPFNVIQAVATGVMGAASINKILSTSPESGGGGGGGVSAPAASTPAPQMMSGAFELSGGLAPEPTRAYVVTDEMTNSQNQLANIRRRATI